MSSRQEIRYTAGFLRCAAAGAVKTFHPIVSRPMAKRPGRSIPRIARLMALAIRFEGLLRDQTIRDYAELARLGRVSRARMTQIMKLLDLAPDIQEQILFLPLVQGLNERNLRTDRQPGRLARAAAPVSEDHGYFSQNRDGPDRWHELIKLGIPAWDVGWRSLIRPFRFGPQLFAGLHQEYARHPFLRVNEMNLYGVRVACRPKACFEPLKTARNTSNQFLLPF